MDKGSLMEDVEQIVLYQVAQQVIGNLSDETRKKVLEASLTNTLDNILRPWDVQKAIENDVYKYMVEYLKHSEVQERIKNATEKTVDKLMNGVIETIISTSQDAIKSNYKTFIEKK